MSQPLIDIFIPYWGDPGYAQQAVSSVVAQSHSQWRLTVVDDAYPSSELADFITALDHPQVHYVRRDHNIGITASFADCVSRAALPLTVILGYDDRLLPHYVDHIVAAHREWPQASIIQPGVEVINAAGTVVRPLTDRVKTDLVKPRGTGNRLLGGEQLATGLLIGDWLYWPSLAFRTDRLQRYSFRQGFPVIQDLALIMDMVFAGEELVTFDEACFQYRRHRRSASVAHLANAERFADERAYFTLAAELATAHGWNRAARAAKSRLTSRAHALVELPRTVAGGDIGTAGRLLRHAFGS